MNQLQQLKRHLKPGRVYRRSELLRWSKSIDRHLDELVSDGVLRKLQQGLYHYPRQSAFGPVPADEHELVRRFLKEDDFLVTPPNAYNTLGLGTTQLYNVKIVYNRRRHGKFELDGHHFDFRRKPHYPKKLTREFLVVDLLNNLKSLEEDSAFIRANLRDKARELDEQKLRRAAQKYGKVATRKFFEDALANAS
jgi:hypothetical protein